MRMPDGATFPLKVRSLVGLLPLCAATVFDGETSDRNPDLLARAQAFIDHFAADIPAIAELPRANADGHRMLSLVDEAQLRQILTVMLDEDEFLGPHGIRAISRRHLDQPCRFDWDGRSYDVRYLPAESDTGMFGGNSNWRGPVWFPMNLVIVRALLQLHSYYGDAFTIPFPTGSGRELNLRDVAMALSERLVTTFTRDEHGRRPVYGGIETFQNDPHWRDLILFHEYFHGDNGAGLGASHQTGWTGTVALLLLEAAGLQQPSAVSA
jgi:mannosylglycerate hydrolase MGH1-like protein